MTKIDELIVARLAAAGLLVPPTFEEVLPEGETVGVLEGEFDPMLSRRPHPLRLADAVIEDRR